ncbi:PLASMODESMATA CALLOSE-BINDING PROTEIN 2 [Prunus yedoensis var. nudiflora]|uniref:PLASMODESMATA CALLOSE-BINDING PROTEIN 2 n=1 Tax=Prunus yedoensis var. nudiflora TaxID=2094558 RepID=A0A314YMT4_PRUYE|nr:PLASMODESMATA CALLOSE-BINDING PROTEIN 2 [Prunus yedoensis var. nudiflora]
MPWTSSFVNYSRNCVRLVVFFRVVAGVRMNIGVTFKRYRAIKEVGKIIMSVGVIAYYQLMQVCQAEYFRQLLKPVT